MFPNNAKITANLSSYNYIQFRFVTEKLIVILKKVAQVLRNK